MRRTHLLSAVLAFASCTHHPAPADRAIVLTSPASPPRASSLPSTLEVATFNVHRVSGQEIARGIAHDPVLRGADVIVLTEMPGSRGCGPACVAGRELGMYSAYEPDFLLWNGTLGQAVLSRVPIESARVIELPTYVNRCAALVVTLRVAGKPVTIYAVHLTDQLATDQRLRQIRPVLEDARDLPTPVIIAGDFNLSASFIAHRIPVGDGSATPKFEALVRSYGFATPTTYSGKTFKTWPSRLDAIYTRGFATFGIGTSDGGGISDHLALWAVVALRAPTPPVALRTFTHRTLPPAP